MDNKTLLIKQIPTTDFTIIVIPDTQIYPTTSYFSQYLNKMMDWIVFSKNQLNIRMVLHVGDIVNVGSDTTMWDLADINIDKLDDANIPYLFVPGNHDYDTGDLAIRGLTTFNTYLPTTRYSTKDWWSGGFLTSGHSENNYNIMNIGGIDWLFIGLEYGATDATLSWADALLTTHSEKPSMIFTHCYMYTGNRRVTTGDSYNPKDSALGATANDGEDMWNKLIKLHNNIISVYSGHIIHGTPDAELGSYLASEADDGQIVHQMLSNWQTISPDNNGWLRMMHISPTNKTIKMHTYSPTLFQYRYDGENDLSLIY